MSELKVLSAPAPQRSAVRRRPGLMSASLLAPALALIIAVIVIPLASIFITSITTPSFGLSNYISLFTDGASIRVIGRTLLTAGVVTAGALLLGYPYAYAMSLAGPFWRMILTCAVLVPFWTSMTARNFAWMILEQKDGPIDRGVQLLGGPSTVLFGTFWGVVIAMIQVMLPFMVLPLFSTMSGIDRRLVSAAKSLGSGSLRAFGRVYLPLSLPGAVSGAVLVFALSFGFYVTPAILGSPQQALVAQLLADRTQKVLDFAGAGALGITVLLFTLLLVGAVNRTGGNVGSLGAATTAGGR